MIKKIRKIKKVNSQKGFTLLEILVVLTIMGFLIAMVAPRLAGISGGAVDTVCDTNQNRMVGYLASYHETTHRFPNKLTNLVIRNSSANTYQIPVASNQDPDDGAEVLANELYSRNHFHIHILNDAEASELVDMGIAKLFNLNDYSGMDDAGVVNSNVPNDVAVTGVILANREPSMDPVAPVINVGVAMVGCGYETTWKSVADTVTRGWGEPDNFARIVLGMGPECGLITSGLISNAAHCPGGIQNADNVTYNDYIILLPRLEATAARMPAGALASIAFPTDLRGVAYDDDPSSSPYDTAANGDNLRIRTFDITAAQEGWQFATMCPEGHMYPADDEEFWGIAIGASSNI